MSAPHQDEGFAYYLVHRHDVPDEDRVHSFSKDAEAERLTSGVLGIVPTPDTTLGFRSGGSRKAPRKNGY